MTDTPAERRKTLGLISGSILAACMALVFGACLATALDAIHRPQQAAASARSQASQQAVRIINASF